MILAGLAIIVAVLAVPRIRRTLTIPDARRRAGSPAPRAQGR